MASALFTTGILLIIIFIFIFLFSRFHKRKTTIKKEHQKDLIAGIISDKMLTLTSMEIINDYLVGIDQTNFLLLYYNFSTPEGRPLLIDLWQIKTVEIGTEDISIFEQRKGKPVLTDKRVSQLKIQVTYIDGQAGPDLVLYDYSNTAEDLLHIKNRAGYWCQLIGKAVEEIPNSPVRKSKYA